MILKDIPFQRVEFYSDQTMRSLIGKSELLNIDKRKNLYEAGLQDKSMVNYMRHTGKRKTIISIFGSTLRLAQCFRYD